MLLPCSFSDQDQESLSLKRVQYLPVTLKQTHLSVGVWTPRLVILSTEKHLSQHLLLSVSSSAPRFVPLFGAVFGPDMYHWSTEKKDQVIWAAWILCHATVRSVSNWHYCNKIYFNNWTPTNAPITMYCTSVAQTKVTTDAKQTSPDMLSYFVKQVADDEKCNDIIFQCVNKSAHIL